jgi:hypothetical protein
MRRAIVIALALALALCSCERDKHDQTIEMAVPKVTVKVVDPGAEPRLALRLAPKPGARATFDAKVSGELETPRRGPMQTASFAYESEVVDVSGGVVHIRQRVTEASVASQVGRTFETWTDARGAHVRPTLAGVPPDSTAEGDAPEPEISLVFPEEAVGVGARWHDDVVMGDATASCDVELLSRDGDRVRERIVFHSVMPVLKSPAHRDGTMIEEFSLSDPDGSMHRNETFSIDFPQGRATGTRTSDIVRRP